MRVNPYLNFRGDCKEAFEFYEKVFQSKIGHLITNRNSPMAEQTPPDLQDTILHVAMKIGETIVYGSDAPPAYYKSPGGGLHISVSIETIEEAERIFAELSDGAQIAMPLQEMFWAFRFGMLTDRFGIPWMINCEKPMN
jgi:PhnB protein